MVLLVIYIGVCILGCIVGVRLRKKGKEIKWSGKVQNGLLVVLLVTMGCRLGANKEVVSSIVNIGWSALIITIFAMGGSLLMVMGVRKLLGFDKKGDTLDD